MPGYGSLLPLFDYNGTLATQDAAVLASAPSPRSEASKHYLSSRAPLGSRGDRRRRMARRPALGWP